MGDRTSAANLNPIRAFVRETLDAARRAGGAASALDGKGDRYFYEMMRYSTRTPPEPEPSELAVHVNAELTRRVVARWVESERARWRARQGGPIDDVDEFTLYYDLNKRLREAFAALGPARDEALREECVVRVRDDPDGFKALFHFDPVARGSFYAKSECESSAHRRYFDNLSDAALLAYPNLAVRVDLPHLRATRRNPHRAEYRVVNLTPDYAAAIRPSLGPDDAATTGPPDAQLVPFERFAELVRSVRLMCSSSRDLPDRIGECLTTALAQLEIDARLSGGGGGGALRVGKTYLHAEVEYPYVRYLGRDDDDARSPAAMREQVRVDASRPINARLEQVAYPAWSFTLERFEPPADRLERHEAAYLQRLKFDGVRFECERCGGGVAGDHFEIRWHLATCHGDEPDWACSRCARVFSTKYLCSKRWKHACDPAALNAY